MRRMIMACLVVCMAACGGSDPGADGPRDPATAGAEDGTGPDATGPVARGETEHDCELRRERECADLACRWVDDPDATPASTEAAGEDTSLRDDVTLGPRRATTEGEGQLCVHAGDGGETSACPAVCCMVCPRE